MNGIRARLPEQCAGIWNVIPWVTVTHADKWGYLYALDASCVASLQEKLARLRATLRILSCFLSQVLDNSLRMDNIH